MDISMAKFGNGRVKFYIYTEAKREFYAVLEASKVNGTSFDHGSRTVIGTWKQNPIITCNNQRNAKEFLKTLARNYHEIEVTY